MKKYHLENRARFAGALVCVLASTLFAVALQFFKGDVLDYAVAGQTQLAVRYAVYLGAFILAECFTFYLYRRLSAHYAAACTESLKCDIFRAILCKSYIDYRSRPQGEYISAYTTDADAVRTRRFALLPVFWEILFRILLVSGALLLLDWRLALVTIGLLTTPLYIPKLIEKRLQRAQTDYLSAVKDSLAKLNDWLAGFEIIKNFSVERSVMARFEKVNSAAMSRLLKDTQLGATAQLITTLMSYLSYFAVLVCAARLVLSGRFSAGDFFVAIGMIDQLSYPLISLAEIIRQLISMKPACTAMEKFIAEAPTQKEAALTTVQREIRFGSVTFAYDGQPPVLKDFTLTLRRGGHYLLQGPSGCGKTTAVNLLLRYFEPDCGSITIDGRSINELGSPYGCMTVVRQEAVLFHDTLRHNLTMYRDIPDERLIAMLRSLGLEALAAPEALSAMVEENGANLSGGEKKRICLARALLRDTDVLLLDEPLANLDDAAAARIEDLLLSIQGKTMLVVSHQFTPEKLGQFDQVISLKAGT